MKGELSVRQVGIFCFFTMLANKILIFPSLVYQEAKNSAIITLVISFAIEILFLYIFIKLKEKYINKSLFDILSEKIGVFLTKLIYFLLFLIFIMQLAFLVQEKFDYLKDHIFEEASIIRFFLVIFPIATALVYRGITAFGRTSEFYYFFILTGFIICIVLGLSSLPEFSLPHYTDVHLSNIFTSCYKYFFWFSDFYFFIVLLDKVKAENGFGRQIFKFVWLSAALLIIFYFTYYSIYSTTAFMHRSALSDLTQFLSKLSSVEKLNIVAILTMSFICVFQAGIYMTCMLECAKKIFPKPNDVQYLIIINILASVLSYYAYINNEIYIKILTNYAGAVAIILPIILCTIFVFLIIFDKKVKKRRKNEKIYS